MRFARWIFLGAGILGLIPVVPILYDLMRGGQELLTGLSGMGLFFYVFLLQYVCWQVFYILLSRDPLHHRPMMILAFIVEIISAFNTIWLYFYGFTLWKIITIAGIAFAVLFLVAFRLTGRELRQSAAWPTPGLPAETPPPSSPPDRAQP